MGKASKLRKQKEEERRSSEEDTTSSSESVSEAGTDNTEEEMRAKIREQAEIINDYSIEISLMRAQLEILLEQKVDMSPKRKKKNNRDNAVAGPSTQGLETTNRFAALEEEEIEMDTDTPAPPPTPTPPHAQKQVKRTYAPYVKDMKQKDEIRVEKPVVQKKASEENRPATTNVTVEKRSPVETTPKEKEGRRVPVIVADMNTAEVVKELKKKNIVPDMRRNGRGGKTTMLVKEEEKHEVLRILTETNAHAHSYPTSGERTYTKMLMNVDKSFTTQETHKDILDQITALPTLVGKFTVNRLETSYSRRNGLVLPYLEVRAENKHTLDMILSLNRINYVRPRWEEVRRPEYTQCYNCLELGHTRTGGCTRPKACKACPAVGDDHVCTVKMQAEINEKGEKQNPFADYYCRLCKEKGHPARWAGCPYIQKKITEIKENAIRKQERTAITRGFMAAPAPTNNVWNERRNVPMPRREREPVRYEDVEPQQQQQQQSGGMGPTGSFLDEEVRRLLGTSAANLQRLAEEFVARYKGLTSDDEKRQALGAYYVNINQWRN